jgi:hypothetical protein
MPLPSPKSLLLLCGMVLLSLGCAETKPCPDGECDPLPTCESQADCGQGTCAGEVCMRCGADMGCSLGASVCDAASGQCRGCASDSECGGGTPVCRANKCVQCSQDTQCGGATPFCNGIHCVSCRTHADCGTGLSCSTAGYCTNSCGGDAACPASAPRCSGAFGVCVECLSEADCAPGLSCFGNACRQPLPGTACTSPLALDLASGTARVGGDLRPYWYVTSTFGTNAGFYRFTVTQDVLVSGDLVFQGTVVRGALSILASDCSKVLARSTVDDFADGAWRLRDVYLAPGTYMAVVSQEVVQESIQGAFTLHLWTAPTTRAIGTHCLKPLELTPDAQGRAAVRVSTTGAQRIFTDFCGQVTAAGRGSIVHRLKLSAASRVRAELVPLSPGMNLRLARNTSCGAPFSNQCAPAAGPGGTETQEASLIPGTYSLLVHDEAGVPGDYELRVQVDPTTPQ